MTKSDFARKINRAPARVSEWVSGKRIPSPESCDIIADALSIDLDDVLDIAGHRPKIEGVDPNSPKAVILGLVNRVDWSDPGKFKVIQAALRTMVEPDAPR